MLRPIGSPLPLGFLALFTGSLLLSALQLHWIPAAQTHIVAIAILGFTAPLQLIACVFGFLARDPVCGTGIGVLFGTWVTAGATLLGTSPGGTNPGFGVLLVTTAAVLLVPSLVAATSKVIAAVVIAAAAIRFAVSGGYELTGAAPWQHSSGIAGLIVAGLAGYGAVALELESAFGRTVLPVLRHHRGRRAVSEPLSGQVTRVAHEAGVREQL